MPIRVPQGSTRFYRRFQYGNLVDLSMLDLRQYRDEQPASPLDPAKWLQAGLGTARAQWKLVGNPVMITPVDFRQPLAPEILEQFGILTGVPLNVDAWDGYTDDRRELLEFIASRSVQNVAFLTGDIHSSWAANVPLGAGTSPSVAVELVGTSITDLLGLPERNPTSLQTEAVFQAGNPHVRYLQLDSHGYSIVDVTAARLQMDWYYISVQSGTNEVRPAAGPIPPRV
jgi:alkaline phosphatase D